MAHASTIAGAREFDGARRDECCDLFDVESFQQPETEYLGRLVCSAVRFDGFLQAAPSAVQVDVRDSILLDARRDQGKQTAARAMSDQGYGLVVICLTPARDCGNLVSLDS